MKFETIYQRAAERKGGVKELELLLPADVKPKAVAAVDVSRFLAR